MIFVLLLLNINLVLVQVNLTYCMWENDFTCDVLAKNGSAHISSLVKWRPSIFIEA